MGISKSMPTWVVCRSVDLRHYYPRPIYPIKLVQSKDFEFGEVHFLKWLLIRHSWHRNYAMSITIHAWFESPLASQLCNEHYNTCMIWEPTGIATMRWALQYMHDLRAHWHRNYAMSITIHAWFESPLALRTNDCCCHLRPSMMHEKRLFNLISILASAYSMDAAINKWNVYNQVLYQH
jgi:hypothetical protein